MENDMYLNRLRKWLTVSLVLSFIPFLGMLLALPITFLGLLTLSNHPNDYVRRSQRFLLGGMALGGLIIIGTFVVGLSGGVGSEPLVGLFSFLVPLTLIVGFALSFLAFANLMNIPEIKQTKKVYVEYILYVFLIIFASFAYNIVVRGIMQSSQAYMEGIGMLSMVGGIIFFINARRICKIEAIAPVQGNISSVADLLRSNQCVGMIAGILVSVVFCLLIK
ncbi:hypothetical protein [Phocaeicola sp.]